MWSLEGAAREVYPEALEQAVIETSLDESTFPSILPYTVEQILGRMLPAAELPDQRSTGKKHR